MQHILSLDPYMVPGRLGCVGCGPSSGMGVIYSLDPFITSPSRGMGAVVSLDPFIFTPGTSLGMGGLGEHPWMASGQCDNFAKLVDIYTKLSQKTDKSKATRDNAAKLAQENQQMYNECVDRKAGSVVQQTLSPTPTPTPTPMPTPAIPVTQVMPVPAGTLATTTAAQSTSAQTGAQQGFFTPRNMMIAGGVIAAAALAVYLVKRRK